MKKARKKRIVRRKRRVSEKKILRLKRKLMKRARKLRLGAKRTGAYVYGTLRRIVGNPAIPAHMGNPDFVREFRVAEMRARLSGEPVGLYAYQTKSGWNFITRKQSMYRPPGEELVVLFGEKRGLRGNPYPTGGMTPLERLRYHVSGAIARGEAKPITDLSGLVPRKPRMVRVLGYDVVEGSKKHMRLLAQKRHFDDLQRSERGLRGNGMDDKRNKWQLFGYDVWGNEEDGYNVNDIFPGPVVTLTSRAEYNARAFDNAMRRRGSNLRYSMIDQGRSDEDTLYFDTPSGKPIAEMRRLK